MSEIDAKNGDAYAGLKLVMKKLGYNHSYFEMRPGISGSAIFYKEKDFTILESKLMPFEGGASTISNFYMHSVFCLNVDPDLKFVFG